MTAFHRSEFIPNCEHITEHGHFTELLEVYIGHLRRVWHADRGGSLLRHLVPSHLGLACVPFVATNFYPKLVAYFYRTVHSENP